MTRYATAACPIPCYGLIEFDFSNRQVAHPHVKPYFSSIRACISSASTASISPRR
jgi:hypothetical protein